MDLCKACNYEIKGTMQFCSKCGSKVINERLTIKRLVSDSFKVLTNLEGPFLRTTIALFTTPESVTIGYVNGKRKLINSPIRYAIITLTAYAIFQFLFQDFVNELANNSGISNFLKGLNESQDFRNEVNMKRAEEIQLAFKRHSQFTNFMVIPVIAFISSRIYSSSQYNYAEHISISIYAVSLSLLLGAISGILLGAIKSEVIINIYPHWTMIINIFVIIWIIWRSYNGNVLKAISTFLISYFIFVMIFSVIVYLITRSILG